MWRFVTVDSRSVRSGLLFLTIVCTYCSKKTRCMSRLWNVRNPIVTQSTIFEEKPLLLRLWNFPIYLPGSSCRWFTILTLSLFLVNKVRTWELVTRQVTLGFYFQTLTTTTVPTPTSLTFLPSLILVILCEGVNILNNWISKKSLSFFVTVNIPWRRKVFIILFYLLIVS